MKNFNDDEHRTEKDFDELTKLVTIWFYTIGGLVFTIFLFVVIVWFM